MVRNRLYYFLKPLLPWGVRNQLRQRLAWRQRARSQAIWPINPATSIPPSDWTGWPDGADVAVVLTHDVEGSKGLARVGRLAQLEKSLGFRSSYNFIPEGEYPVPSNLRVLLEDMGFEVGVHDLRHDGHLLKDRDSFRQNAQRINHYLREWKAVGFRAGFMLHNLEWFHDLNVAYDLSTFDTDPFEPQPDAANTIFPFWVAAPNAEAKLDGQPRRGYWEFPYTLAQDSTLFLVLREKTPDIWYKKVDWLVEKKGLILVNVHPDYTRFPDEPESKDTFPVEHYINLLKYIKDRYTGRYWQPLPKELAGEMERKSGNAEKLKS